MCKRRGGGNSSPVRPELSGKMFVLWRLMVEMRKPYCRDKIVIISNYTQTLDLIGRMCNENGWAFCRLDGSIGMKKRQKMVDDFNDPTSNLIAFLLSSKAGGCGLNLIGGNRLVLFDPDWNPAGMIQSNEMVTDLLYRANQKNLRLYFFCFYSR